ncbi:hypothetical protein LINGRAHAP2_LOCUS30422 [Linum grandiflorum]
MEIIIKHEIKVNITNEKVRRCIVNVDVDGMRMHFSSYRYFNRTNVK